MDQQPRPTREPIINKYMQGGIVVQTIAITGSVLAAYFIGRAHHPLDSGYAETMAFVTLSLSELFRAYTSRSEYYPLLKIGFFKNQMDEHWRRCLRIVSIDGPLCTILPKNIWNSATWMEAMGTGFTITSAPVYCS